MEPVYEWTGKYIQDTVTSMCGGEIQRRINTKCGSISIMGYHFCFKKKEKSIHRVKTILSIQIQNN